MRPTISGFASLGSGCRRLGTWFAIIFLGWGMLVAADGLPQGDAQPPGWRAVPLVSAGQRAAGKRGGEGGQWHRSIAIDASGEFLLYGTDVGGLWRSQDSGRTWEPCNVGYGPRGTAAVAIDPGNPKRCLSVGANSMPNRQHGLWLSEDGAASWRHVLPLMICGSQDKQRRQFAYDPATWDTARQRTNRVYWTRIANDAAFNSTAPSAKLIDRKPALWRSDDGGTTWLELAGTAEFAGGEVAVSPQGGVVYASNQTGLWSSRDGGTTFQRLRSGPCTALDVQPQTPASIWVTTPDALLRSDDQGATWTTLVRATGLPGSGPLRDLRVSPRDPQRLAFWRQGTDYAWPRFTSHDGGRTVVRAVVDGSQAFLPCNAREHAATWSPVDPAVCWSSGGDLPTVSRDGAQTFLPASEGFNCVLVGGLLAFNVRDPDLLMVGSQDYNGAVTRDGGRTWSYTPVSGEHWGGFTYGGYAIDTQTLIVGDQQAWSGPTILCVSRDGGATWTNTGLAYDGARAAYGDPLDPQVAFAGSLRTADRAGTWERMSACTGVFAHDGNGRLYGHGPGGVVASSDHGVTWSVLAPVAGTIKDLAVSNDGRQVWAVVDAKELRRWDGAAWSVIDNLIPDQDPLQPRISSVAVDPTDSRIVYVGRCRDSFTSSVSVQRSCDGGTTWTNLTEHEPLANGRKDGGREAFCVRVHPKTRALWVTGACFGIWSYPAPVITANPKETP
jgi:photosystem II stability/assembly factor-like uncharacterized protein